MDVWEERIEDREMMGRAKGSRGRERLGVRRVGRGAGLRQVARGGLGFQWLCKSSFFLL